MKILIYLFLICFSAEIVYSQELDTVYGARYVHDKNHEMLIEKLAPQLISFVTSDGYFGTEKVYMRYTGLFLPTDLSNKNLRAHLTKFMILEPGIKMVKGWKYFLQSEPYMMLQIRGKTIVVISYKRNRKFPNELTIVSYLEIYE